MRANGSTFIGQEMVIDGGIFENCAFIKCTLVFGGGELPQLRGCTFTDIRFIFIDSAKNTLNLIAGLYHGGLQDAVESMFEHIRRAPPPDVEIA